MAEPEPPSFIPAQPDKGNAAQKFKLLFTDSDQLQQHVFFHALQAPSPQEWLVHAPTLSSSSVHDPCSSSHAPCSSDSHEAYQRLIHQRPCDYLYHQYVCANQCVSLQLHDELQAYAKLKAEIVAHPLFENLLQAHVKCLSVGISSDQLQALETQLAKRDSIIMKYIMQGKNVENQSAASLNPSGCRREIDTFMENYLQLILLWKNYLEELVTPPTIKALSTLCEIKHAFCDLTGILSNEISTSSMTIDEELEDMCFASDVDVVNYELEAQRSIDRFLFEHLQMELKNKLKDSYRETIHVVRQEIIKKRQAGKLPGDISPLKKWWNAHSRWPYPSEQEKRKLVQETGLEMRQINNWFINHRKRHWPSHYRHPAPPSSNYAASAGSSSLLQG